MLFFVFAQVFLVALSEISHETSGLQDTGPKNKILVVLVVLSTFALRFITFLAVFVVAATTLAFALYPVLAVGSLVLKSARLKFLLN